MNKEKDERINKVHSIHEQRLAKIKHLIENGFFIPRDLLEIVNYVAGKKINVTILGETLLDGTKTSRPQETIGIKLGISTLNEYDDFWRKIIKIRSGDED